MSAIESSCTTRRPNTEILPRHPQQEIAELLAAAVLRARTTRHEVGIDCPSDVCLAYTADQSVHTNPSDTEGVRT